MKWKKQFFLIMMRKNLKNLILKKKLKTSQDNSVSLNVEKVN